MNEKEYLNHLSAEIGKAIAEKNPVMKIEDRDVFSVISDFLSEAIPEIGQDMIDAAVDTYIAKILQNVRQLDPELLEKDPYVQRVHFNTVKSGRYLLTNSFYEKGEILQYDFPLQEDGIYLPRLGYFTRKTNFPSIYEGNIPWMSVIPSEINTMKTPIDHAHGKMLVLGLGLGYYAYMIGRKKDVQDITVIEQSAAVIQLFKDSILPQFEPAAAAKIHIIQADALQYMKNVQEGQYDGIFADLWQGAVDGAADYHQLHPYEQILKSTKFDYWIERYLHE